MKKLILAGLLAMSSFSMFAAEEITKDRTIDYLTKNASLFDCIEIGMKTTGIRARDFIVDNIKEGMKYTGYALLATTTLVALGALGHASVQQDKAFGEAFVHGFTMLGGQVIHAIPSAFSFCKNLLGKKEVAQAATTIAQGTGSAAAQIAKTAGTAAVEAVKTAAPVAANLGKEVAQTVVETTAPAAVNLITEAAKTAAQGATS